LNFDIILNFEFCALNFRIECNEMWPAPTLCRHHGFRFYFTGVTLLLFTFPSRYWFTIGDIKYLVLPGRPGCFPRGYRSSRYSSKIARSMKGFSNTGLLPSMVPLSKEFFLTNLHLCTLPRVVPRQLCHGIIYSLFAIPKQSWCETPDATPLQPQPMQ
jgi:hypothetical protein